MKLSPCVWERVEDTYLYPNSKLMHFMVLVTFLQASLLNIFTLVHFPSGKSLLIFPFIFSLGTTLVLVVLDHLLQIKMHLFISKINSALKKLNYNLERNSLVNGMNSLSMFSLLFNHLFLRMILIIIFFLVSSCLH